MKKVLVILGQTATGKSALAVKIAQKFNGEIISADSRQVYRGIDQGSGKISKAEMGSIPHHLLDVANPKTQFSVSQYKKLAEEKIKEIIKRNKIPILVGGSGFYIDAVTKGIILPKVEPDILLRKSLENKSAIELVQILKKLDPERAKNIDQKNKVRLIRAIEIARCMGSVPKLNTKPPGYDFIKLGFKFPDRTLQRKIKSRLRERLRNGMAMEIATLHKKGVPWERFIELGFDQRYITHYLQGKIKSEELLEVLYQKNWQYAKRQMTWFKRDKDIKWFTRKDYREIFKFVSAELSK